MQPLHDPSPVVRDDQQGGSTVSALQRRQLLLKGLGKGSVAAAALLPLSSHATRSYVLANAAVQGGKGYCSVSGFQSAAISVKPGMALTTCSANPPSAYYTTLDQNYSWNSGQNSNQSRNNRRTAIRSLFVAQFGFVQQDANNIPDTLVDSFTTVNTPVIIGGQIYWATAYSSPAGDNQPGSGNIRQLKSKANYPGSVLTALPLRSFENMMDNTGTTDVVNPNATQSVLYTLYNIQSNNKAYFAAVALGCIVEDGDWVSSNGFNAGLIPFDAKYVGDMYNDTTKQAAAGAFFKTLCGA